MKKIICFALLIQVFSCSDDDSMTIDNQIGDWEGMKIVERLTEDMDTISIDTSMINVLLNEDLTGIYNTEIVINWEKNYNSQIDRDIIKITLENNSTIQTQIFLDELNYQEWADFSIFQGTLDRQNVYYKLNRK